VSTDEEQQAIAEHVEQQDRERADPEVWNAAAAAIPQEWEDAACAHYSMHGNGLVRNILAGVEPLIRADERERIARFTWDMGVTYTADDGSRLPFADLIREGS
jgi:hypothetical protein